MTDRDFYLVQVGGLFKSMRALDPSTSHPYVKIRKAVNRGLPDRQGNRHINALPTADAQAFA